MTYALCDDKTFRNVALRECGPMAALLYITALFECAAIDGDGVLTPMMVKDAAALYDISSKARQRHTDLLVAKGLWHDDPGLAGCGECLGYTDRLDAGDLLIHEWWKPLLHKDGKQDPVKRSRELRRKRLWRNKELVLAVRTRDKDLCRYCGVLCTDSSGPDKKAPTNLTLDHIDPFGDNTLANLAVACRQCNGIKRDRTPEQAGMHLLKSGTTSDTVSEDQTPGSDTNQPRTRVAREAGRIGHGSGLAGSGVGSVSGRERSRG